MAALALCAAGQAALAWEFGLLDAYHTGLCYIPHAAAEQPGVSYGYGLHIIDDGVHGRVIGHGGRALGGPRHEALVIQ